MILFVGLAIATLAWAQEPRQLEVQVAPSGQVKILARAVSYGEVLRALQAKLGVRIEIPEVADELELGYVHIAAAMPNEALARLLEGSGLGYGWLGRKDQVRPEKIVIVTSASQQANAKTVPRSASDRKRMRESRRRTPRPV